MKRTPECDMCGKRLWITPWDRLPAMLEFETEEGKRYRICRKCLMELGTLRSKESRDEFFAELERKAGNEDGQDD